MLFGFDCSLSVRPSDVLFFFVFVHALFSIHLCISFCSHNLDFLIVLSIPCQLLFLYLCFFIVLYIVNDFVLFGF